MKPDTTPKDLLDLDVSALQNRFLEDVEAIVREQSLSAHRHRYVLLSGGIDSLVMVAVNRHLWPDNELETITIRGHETEDLQGAQLVADHFGTVHHVFDLSVDTIVDSIDRLRGAGYVTMGRLMFHLSLELCLETFDLRDSDVYTGLGANYIFGYKPQIYQDAEELARKEACSLEEIRNRLKTAFFQSAKEHFTGQRSTSMILGNIVRRMGGNLVQPFLNQRLQYIQRIPYSVINPLNKNKGFVKEALRRRYGLGDIVERPRIGLQTGTGLKEELGTALMASYGHLGDSPHAIAMQLTS